MSRLIPSFSFARRSIPKKSRNAPEEARAREIPIAGRQMMATKSKRQAESARKIH
jgi:hypothetical protein